MGIQVCENEGTGPYWGIKKTLISENSILGTWLIKNAIKTKSAQK